MIRLLLLALLLLPAPAGAGDVRVAVAANFRGPLALLAQAFEVSTGHRIVASAGSTGQLYAQIVRGAPFDLFLAADQARPKALADAGLTAKAPKTYATGRLVLIVPGQTGTEPPDLDRVRTFSIANPATAPYGAAAVQVMAKLDLPKTVRTAKAQSIAGVSAALAAGAAQAGLAAASLDSDGTGWPVPQDWHDPIRQDMVLLARGAERPAALALWDWLGGADAQALIRAQGYDVD